MLVSVTVSLETTVSKTTTNATCKFLEVLITNTLRKMLVSVTVSLETTVSKTTTNSTCKFVEVFTKTVQITTA